MIKLGSSRGQRGSRRAKGHVFSTVNRACGQWKDKWGWEGQKVGPLTAKAQLLRTLVSWPGSQASLMPGQPVMAMSPVGPQAANSHDGH